MNVAGNVGRRVTITPQEALQRTIEHREIFHDEMIELMRQIMRGEVSPLMTAAIITGLRVKKETVGEILAAGLANSKHGREIMKECIEEAAARVIHELERYINALGTIAAMAPLLGLLGTVLGMIDIFSSFMSTGMTTNAAVLAGGISKALITTASGLIVGIPSVFFHRFLQRRIDELVVGMEQEAIKLVEVVQGDRDVDLAEGKA